MLTSRLTRGAVTAAVAALAFAGLSSAPALAAAAPATLQVQVVDSVTEQPVANIEVYALPSGDEGENSDDTFVDFGATDSDGEVAVPAGGYEGSKKLTAGTWDFFFSDVSNARTRSGTTYAYTQKQDVPIAAGANDLGEQPVDVGGTVTGTARTPSGHLLRGLTYEILTQGADPDNDEAFADGGQTEYGDATFESGGLPVGTFDLLYDSSANGYGESDDTFRRASSFTISEPGQSVVDDLAVRVDATRRDTTLAATSPAKGTARLVFKIANENYDITDPGGVVTVMSAQGKTIGDPVPVEEVNGHGKAVITFPATTGSHTYRAYYSTSTDHPADLRSTSRTTKLAVR